MLTLRYVSKKRTLKNINIIRNHPDSARYSNGWSLHLTKLIQDRLCTISRLFSFFRSLFQPRPEYTQVSSSRSLRGFSLSFKIVLVLSKSVYEHFNFDLNQAYWSTSKRLQTMTHGTVRNLDISLKRKNFSYVPPLKKSQSLALSLHVPVLW